MAVPQSGVPEPGLAGPTQGAPGLSSEWQQGSKRFLGCASRSGPTRLLSYRMLATRLPHFPNISAFSSPKRILKGAFVPLREDTDRLAVNQRQPRGGPEATDGGDEREGAARVGFLVTQAGQKCWGVKTLGHQKAPQG